MRQLPVAAFVAVVVGTSWACQAVPPAESRTAESAGALVERPDAPARPPLVPFDAEAERRAKAAGATPMAVDLVVDEAAAATHRPLAAAGLSPTDIARLGALPLPVLLPDDPALLERALVTSGERWYSASLPLDGHMVLITGRARGFRMPEGALDLPPSNGGLLLTRSEGVVIVSFRLYGVSYSIFVECASPEGDPRCTEDAYALRLAEQLGRLEAGR